MRILAAFLASLTLIGCVPDGGTSVPVPTPDVSTLRNPTAQVASQADVAAQDLSGVWFVRQSAGNRWPASETRVTFQPDGANLIVVAQGFTCQSTGTCEPLNIVVTYTPLATGRWQRVMPSSARADRFPSELWVYWMDFDDRTMAIGNPNGDMVAILDRSATGGGDRIIAARDILDWFGYDLSQIREVSQ